MTNKQDKCSRESYSAPECNVLSFFEEKAICETSFTGGDVNPGTGMDWGTF